MYTVATMIMTTAIPVADTIAVKTNTAAADTKREKTDSAVRNSCEKAALVHSKEKTSRFHNFVI